MRKLMGLGVVAVTLAFAGSALAADGAAIFKSKCSPCHGAEGQGTAMAPAFQGNAFLKSGKDADIIATVTDGRAGAAKKYKQFAIAMPAQGKALSAEDILAVIAHEKTLAAKEPAKK